MRTTSRTKPLKFSTTGRNSLRLSSARMRRMTSTRARVVADDVIEGLAHFFEIGSRLVEKVARCLGIAQDGRERLTQLVRERGGQLAHGRYPIEVRHLLLGTAPFRLGALARADVYMGNNRPTLRAVQRLDAHLEPGPVPRALQLHCHPGLTLGEHRIERLDDRWIWTSLVPVPPRRNPA